jgi:hypothetical protein
MSTVSTFNGLLKEFLVFLKQTFPNYTKDVDTTIEWLDELEAINKNKIVEMFMDSTINYTDQILTKQDVFFQNTRDMLSDNIDMYVLWNSVTDQDTKMYIWMYIQQLFFMGSTIIDIDPQLKQIIENFSKGC